MKRFTLFKLVDDQFENLKIDRDTISECIFEAEYSDAGRWAIYDTELKSIVKLNLETSEHSFIKPAIRIAGQDIEEGKTVMIPSQLTLKRNGLPLTIWDKEKLEHHISVYSTMGPLKNSTYLDRVRILQIFPTHVVIEALQVSMSTLRSEISKKTKVLYDKDLVPFNFRRNKIKLNREENKILFI